MSIAKWGGIYRFISDDRSEWRYSSPRYPEFYNCGFGRLVGIWIMRRLAKSGRMTVGEANALLWKICLRYSGTPERTFEASKIDGMGRVTLNKVGSVVATFEFWKARSQSYAAVSEAQERQIAHSDTDTKHLWRAGGSKYEPLKPCRWCGTNVPFKKEWIDFQDTIRCNARDCRRIDFLRYKKQSHGGIALTPAQRNQAGPESFNTYSVINYLAIVAKEAKRANRSANHDIR